MIGDDMACLAWMAVQGKDGVEGKANAAQFFLPRSMSSLVESGRPPASHVPTATVYGFVTLTASDCALWVPCRAGTWARNR